MILIFLSLIFILMISKHSVLTSQGTKCFYYYHRFPFVIPILVICDRVMNMQSVPRAPKCWKTHMSASVTQHVKHLCPARHSLNSMSLNYVVKIANKETLILWHFLVLSYCVKWTSVSLPGAKVAGRWHWPSTAFYHQDRVRVEICYYLKTIKVVNIFHCFLLRQVHEACCILVSVILNVRSVYHSWSDINL